jgi:signal transduction histidine kinase
MAGSGLGLAITKWVAQTHEGTVTAESTVGRGTTFVLTLPVVQSPPGDDGRRQGARAQPVSAR